MGLLAGIGALGYASLAASAVSTAVAIDNANERDDEAKQDAAREKDAYKAQAEQISRARRKQVAAARAATAASGTALDEFSEINTGDIERSGALDEQMTLLTGNRRAESQLYGIGDGARAAAINGASDLLSTGYQVGWKGKKGKA